MRIVATIACFVLILCAVGFSFLALLATGGDIWDLFSEA
jgi:hypothetical protein